MPRKPTCPINPACLTEAEAAGYVRASLARFRRLVAAGLVAPLPDLGSFAVVDLDIFIDRQREARLQCVQGGKSGDVPGKKASVASKAARPRRLAQELLR